MAAGSIRHANPIGIPLDRADAPPMPKLYVKSGCPWCEEALEFLERHQIEHETTVVTGDRAAMQEMVDLSGQSKAPVLDWDGDVLADFGADELEPFLRERGVI